MTKKHFDAIAKGFAYSRPTLIPPASAAAWRHHTDLHAVWSDSVDTVARHIARVSPNFDTARFIEACYV